MERQMFFEEIMSPGNHRGEDRQLPSEQRDALVGLLAELMGRTLAPDDHDMPKRLDAAHGTDAVEGCTHE